MDYCLNCSNDYRKDDSLYNMISFASGDYNNSNYQEQISKSKQNYNF